MRPIDGDALIEWIKESQHQTSKMKNVICRVETMPTIKTKQIKYYDEDENAWKIGEVIVDE